jgi:hypothetical protein
MTEMKTMILVSIFLVLSGCVQEPRAQSKTTASIEADRLHALLAESAHAPKFIMNSSLPVPPRLGISRLELEHLQQNLASVRFPAREGTVEQLFEHQFEATMRIDGDTFTNPGGDLGGTILEYPLNDKLVLRVNHENYQFEGRTVTVEGFADIVPKTDW